MRWHGYLALLVGVHMSTLTAAELQLEAKIPLGDIHGRIDHLALDPGRQRLYVAELGNDSVGVIDLAQRKTLRTLSGFKEPQGIGYSTTTDTLYVANAGDGSVRMLAGSDLRPIEQVSLGEDADNVRVDDGAHRVFVGYGGGAIAIIDSASRQKVTDIPLPGHPESFQLDPGGERIFVNVPDARAIVVLDRKAATQSANWKTNGLSANYPLALDLTHHWIFAVFRHPATVGAFSIDDGRSVFSVKTCGDADDVFVDSKRNRLYVICGEGYVDVKLLADRGLTDAGRIPTVSGARTGLLMSDLDLLAVAVRATFSVPASIWLFKPAG